MLKLTFRRFAASALAAAFGFSGAAATAQLTETPAPPRLDTPRVNTAEPAADSRAGGALSQDADPVEGADIVDEEDIEAADLDPDAADLSVGDRDVDVGGVIDTEGDDLELGAVEGTTFAGVVTGVSEDRISVQMTPPRVPVAMEQVFKVTDRTPVIVDGRRATLGKIKKGDIVRILALPGDPEVAARVLVGTPPAQRRSAREAQANQTRRPVRAEPAVAVGQPDDSEDVDLNFDVYPDSDSPPTPPRGLEDEERMARLGGEEAVLSLGIEVFGHRGSGALVTEMLAAGPAAQSGMLIGDLMTAVNNQPIADPEMIEQLMAVQDGTATVEVTVLRNGQPLQLTIQPAPIVDGGLATAAAIREAFAAQGVVDFGAGVAGVGADVVLPFGAAGLTDFADGGVVVGGVEDQLLGGLLPNDTILGINGQPIQNRAALIGALNGLPQDGDTFGVDVLRNGERVTLDVPFGALQDFRANAPVQDGANVGPGTGRSGRSSIGTGAVPRRPGRSAATVGGTGAGRSAAAQPGATSSGRSAARQGSITSGRSQAAPGNNLPGTVPPAQPGVNQTQPGATQPGATPGTGAGGTGTSGGAGATGGPGGT